MAEAVRNWTKLLAIAAVLTGAATAVFAQSAGTGSLAGKLTDLHSRPLAGVTVIVRNQATGAEARASTAKNGAYRFNGLSAGEYTLRAESPLLGQGQVEDIQVDAGQEARVQAAVDLRISAPEPVQAVNHSIQQVAPVRVVPVLVAKLPSELSRPLVLTGRSLQLPARTIPSVVATQLTVVLPSEPLALETVYLPSRSVQHPMRTPPPVTVPVLSATLLAELPPPLTLPSRSLPSTYTPRSPAVAAAASTLSQQPAPAPTEPIQAAVEKSGPAAPAVTSKLSGDELQALPMSGRNWQDFVLDTPTNPVGGEVQASEHAGGREPAAVTVDGSSMRLAFGGQSGSGQTGMVRAWSGGHRFAVSQSAIREVRTVSGNAEAEGGRAAGGGMNVETRHGGNQLHGQGFLYDREKIWGAQNPFTQWLKESAPATLNTVPMFTAEPYTPLDREINWGIGMGRAFRRNKLFWFATLDGSQRNDPGLAMVKHPYLCANPPQCTQQTGFFAQPSNDQMQVLSKRLGLSGANPIAEGLAQYSSELEKLATLLGPTQRSAAQWSGFGRIDWKAAERHSFTLEGTGATWNAPGGGMTGTSETYGSQSFGSSEASEEWLLGRWEAFVTPNLLAVTQASVGRTILSSRPETPSAYEQPLLGPNVWGQLPQIVVDSRYGFTIGNPSRFGAGSYPDERLYRVQESVDWVRGGLLVKAGLSMGHNSDTIGLLRNKTGTFTYSTLENFVSDALAFKSFGISNQSNNQHGCDQTGTVWRDSGGGLRGQGGLPCYSYYSQTLGPSGWQLSTNDWSGYATAQWQAGKLLTLSAGLRWEREQLPPPIAGLENPDLPLTQKLPSLGNDWGPRLSLALGSRGDRWPVLRLGYGMYFGRTENSTLGTVLTQTGSLSGDLSFFIRPTDGLNTFTGTSGAPPFPYVLAGPPLTVVKPGAVEFAPGFRNAEIHQAVVAVEQTPSSHVQVTASAMVSLGRRLPIPIDTNFAPSVNPGSITYAVKDASGLGPIKASQITVPFYASWPSPSGAVGRLNPNYQQIDELTDKANSTYEAAMLRVIRTGQHGLSVRAHYTYAHAMDWNPNESTLVAGSDVLDPADFKYEYGTSNLDVRHSASASLVWVSPWKLHHLAGHLANGWTISAIGRFRTGLPYTMRTSGTLAKQFESGAAIVGLATGMNGSGGDNRVYGLGSDGRTYNIGRNTYRYPDTWKADMRLGKSFDLGSTRRLEVLTESFNLFNHQNVTRLETTGYYIGSGAATGSLPTLNFLTGAKAGTSAFGQPLTINATNFYRQRQFEVGMRMWF